MKDNLSILVLIAGAVFIYTFGIFNNFFQQDEWGGFGAVIYLSQEPVREWLTNLGGTHFAPFGHLLWLILYKFFGFNAQYFVFVQLVLHIGVSFLVYLLTRNLTKNILMALLAALLFAVNYHASQAFTHLAIFSTTTSCAFLILLFFVFVSSKIGQRNLSLKDVAVFLAIFFAAVSFREDGLLITPLFLLFLFLFDRSKFNKKNTKYFLIFFIPVILFTLFRILLHFSNSHAVPSSSGSSSQALIYNSLTIPIKLFVQNIIEGNQLFLFLFRNNGFIYPSSSVNFLNSYPLFMDFVFLLILNVLILILFFARNYFVSININKYIYFSAAWLILSGLLLAPIGRELYILETRYLYLPSFVVFMTLSIFFVEILRNRPKKIIKPLSIAAKTFVVFVILSLFIFSFINTQRNVQHLSFIGNSRKTLLKNIKKLYPSIPKDTVFFVKCKNECYRNGEFNVSNKLVLPFTLGSGFVLLVNYSKDNEENYARFFKEKVGDNRPFLGDIGSQGYKKLGDYGFGYFYDLNSLKKNIQEKNINKNIVIGLEYDERDFSIRDISTKVREEL